MHEFQEIKRLGQKCTKLTEELNKVKKVQSDQKIVLMSQQNNEEIALMQLKTMEKKIL
jgi:AmiR/NasT family two-component response regulator